MLTRLEYRQATAAHASTTNAKDMTTALIRKGWDLFAAAATAARFFL